MVIKILKNTNRAYLKDSGYTIDEESKLFEEQLEDILQNTRWYLNNYSYLVEYRVSWKDYKFNSPTCPRNDK